jgi:pyruvate dehydrogenase E2 component (dihydrolipoamide acetyltransferase)
MGREDSRRPIRVPDLGLGDCPLRLSVWLVPSGARLTAGDAVVELLTDGAVVNLPAPAPGVLVEKLVPEDSAVTAGQVLAWIEPPGDQQD